MSMEAPGNLARHLIGLQLEARTEEESKTLARMHPEYKAKHTALAVTPHGQVREQVCFPPLKDGRPELQGTTMFVWFDGKPRLTERLRAKGWTTFEDECERSGEPEKVDAYRRLILARLRGTRFKGDATAVLPKTVIEKRESAERMPKAEISVDSFVRLPAERMSALLEGRSPDDIVREIADEEEREKARAEMTAKAAERERIEAEEQAKRAALDAKRAAEAAKAEEAKSAEEPAQAELPAADAEAPKSSRRKGKASNA